MSGSGARLNLWSYSFFYFNKYFNFYFSFLVFFIKIKSTLKSFFLLSNYRAYFSKSNAKKLSTSKKNFKFEILNLKNVINPIIPRLYRTIKNVFFIFNFAQKKK
jgi:hypothetical protein